MAKAHSLLSRMQADHGFHLVRGRLAVRGESEDECRRLREAGVSMAQE